jgi:hypothetical protein
MKLQERIQLAGLLPAQGNFETLVLTKSIKGKIEITPKEVEEFEIKTIQGGMFWNNKGVESTLACDFSEGEKKLIVDSLKEASEKKVLPIDMLDFYEQNVK